MPNLGMFPLGTVLLAQTTVTTSGNSANLTLPAGSSYCFKVQVNTVSGTSPTLVVAVADSADGGTTYDEILSTTTLTTTGSGDQLLIRPYLGIGDAATRASSTLLGVTDIAAAVVRNGPINTQFVKLRWILGGTTPSFSIKVSLTLVPQDLSD